MRPFLDALIVRTADTNERLVAIVRTCFTAVVLVRFVVLGLRGSDPYFELRALIELPIFGASLGFSAWTLVALGRRSLTPLERLVSIVTDSIICFVLLLGNVLWPWPEYQGILQTPDAAALLVVTVGAGFRMSRRLAWLGAALNIMSLAVLFLLDLYRNAAVVFDPASAFVLGLILIGVCGAQASLLARRSTHLVETAASEAEERIRAMQRLQALLQTQHDLKSLLASATLNAGLLRQRLAASQQSALLAGEIERDLAQLVDFVNDRADDVGGGRAPEVLELSDVRELVSELGRHVRGVDIVADLGAAPAEFLVVGGRRALSRALMNVLLNAREGNGARGATRCEIRASIDAGRLHISVEDNGPGFPAQLLDTAPAPGLTTKQNGSGLGLTLVWSVVHESGGELARQNLAAGARVTLTFQLTAPRSAGPGLDSSKQPRLQAEEFFRNPSPGGENSSLAIQGEQ